MKYEAKNVGSVATSQAANAPWGSISHTSATTACRALGTGYDLISNAQWMTIGANVAARAGNWTGGTVGSGYLVSGHSDNNPASTCAASSDDSVFYVETDCTPVSSGDTAEQRRTHTLSNGEVIWDLSGNAAEMIVDSLNREDKPMAAGGIFNYTSFTATTTTAKKDLVPTNAVKAFWSDSWNSAQGIGKYTPYTNGSGGVLTRGGYYDNAYMWTGVFNAELGGDRSSLGPRLGFRCVLTAPVP
jgi:hypothetical protein